MNLNTLHTHILAAANLRVTSDGYVSRFLAGETLPFLVKKQRMVLPTQANMMNPDKVERVFFHPFREIINHGETDVLAAFRMALNTRLNVTIGLLGAQLLQIATSPAEHSKLNPDQSEFLSIVKKADAGTFERFAKILGAIAIDQTKQAFISIFLKRAGQIAGKTYSRVGVVNFPFYQELLNWNKSGDTIYGVQLRIKDHEVLKALMEYLFPLITETGSYSAGSNSDIGPSMEAIMGAIRKISIPINDQIALFSNQLEDVDELTIDTEWVEPLENLGQFLAEIRNIPTQPGNEGSSLKSEQHPQPTVLDAPSDHQRVQPMGFNSPAPFVSAQIPQTQHAPSAPASSKGISFGDAMRQAVAAGQIPNPQVGAFGGGSFGAPAPVGMYGGAPPMQMGGFQSAAMPMQGGFQSAATPIPGMMGGYPQQSNQGGYGMPSTGFL